MAGRTYYFDGFDKVRLFNLDKLATDLGLEFQGGWTWSRGTCEAGKTYESIVFNASLGYPHSVGYIYHGPHAPDHTDPRIRKVVSQLIELCGSTSVINGCSQPYDMSLFLQPSQLTAVLPVVESRQTELTL